MKGTAAGSCVSFLVRIVMGQIGTALPTVDLGYEVHQATYNFSGQYYNFSNIRYGAPPIGNLRFAAPLAPTQDRNPIFNDGSKAVTCEQALPTWLYTTNAWIAQGISAFNISHGYQVPNITLPDLPPAYPTANEDCLFLDVMVPKIIFDSVAGKKSGVAVMVWIHGGGYTLGSKTLYSPSPAGLFHASQLNKKEGMIWVSINYRLGIFGFLSGPTFQKSGGTSNAGLLDQRLALEWVQENIWRFGGDPARVTVMGESAGGGSIVHQITAYGGSKGRVPFHKAIVQSPGFQMMPSVLSQEGVYERFLKDANVETLEQVRDMTSEQLRFINAKIVGESFPYGTFTFNPVVDGVFAPDLPGKLLLEGKYDRSIQVMVGHNINEGIEFMDLYAQTESRIDIDLKLYFPTISDIAIQYITQILYPDTVSKNMSGSGIYGLESIDYGPQTKRLNRMISEAFFTCNTQYLTSAFTLNTSSQPAYSYLFSVKPSLHGDDVAYTYFNGPSPSVKNNTLAEIMQGYFTNFAMEGDPNSHGLPIFEAFVGGDDLVQNLNLTSVGRVKNDIGVPRCGWWQKRLYA